MKIRFALSITFALGVTLSSVSAKDEFKIDYSSSMYQMWDTTTSLWVDNIKSVVTAGNSTAPISIVTQSPANGSWIDVGKSVYYMGNPSRLDSTVGYTWNSTTSTWENSGHTTMLYNGSNISSVNIATTMAYATMVFSYSARLVFSYNDKSQIAYDTTYISTSINPGEKLSALNAYTYGTKIKTAVTFSWNTTTSAWGDTSGIDSTYLNALGDDSITINYYRSQVNATTTEWLPKYRTTTTYTNNNTAIVLQEDYVNNAYRNSNRTVYSYEGSAVLGLVHKTIDYASRKKASMQILLAQKRNIAQGSRLYTITGRSLSKHIASQPIILKPNYITR